MNNDNSTVNIDSKVVYESHSKGINMVATNSPFGKILKKSDLKDGMIVEFNTGKRRLLWKDRLIDYIGFMWFDDIKEDKFGNLRNVGNINYEIIDKVYETHDIGSINDFLEDEHLTVIWNRC